MKAALAHAPKPRTAVETARAKMLLALVAALNRARIPYCLLSGYHDFPDAGTSDVDFMVSPKDAGWVAHILQATSRRSGAILAQAIQHEAGAWYFVLAKPVGGGVAYLHPDCTTDYRRDGRLWLQADELLSRRRKCQSFFVPAIADEFVYYLIKKVLKREITAEQLRRLRALYAQSPKACGAQMRRYWQAKTVSAIASALASDDLEWMQSQLSGLHAELDESAPVERWSARVAQQVRERRRWMDRAMHPTGLTLTIAGGNAPHRNELTTMLQKNLRPAFRRTWCVETPGLGFAPREWLARVRSTLVITARNEEAAGPARHGQICINLSGFVPPDIDSITSGVLQCMAKRMQRRMNLARAS